MPTTAPGNIFAFNMPTWIIDADVSLKELLWNKRVIYFFPIIAIYFTGPEEQLKAISHESSENTNSHCCDIIRQQP